MAKPKTESEKSSWLWAYDAALRSALKDCKKQPFRYSHHFPAGYMRMAQGLSPKTAARKYLAETIYGRQACARKKRAR